MNDLVFISVEIPYILAIDPTKINQINGIFRKFFNSARKLNEAKEVENNPIVITCWNVKYNYADL